MTAEERIDAANKKADYCTGPHGLQAYVYAYEDAIALAREAIALLREFPEPGKAHEWRAFLYEWLQKRREFLDGAP